MIVTYVKKELRKHQLKKKVCKIYAETVQVSVWLWMRQ